MDTKSSTAAQRRAWNYWFEDGLPTLVGGVGCLFFGLCFMFSGRRCGCYLRRSTTSFFCATGRLSSGSKPGSHTRAPGT